MDRVASIPSLIPELILEYNEQLSMIWPLIKQWLIVPVLNVVIIGGLVMSTLFSIELLYMAGVILWVRILGKKPEQRYKWEPFKDDLEMGNSAYPTVLVQIPMYNEKEVYQLSIRAACCLSWPSDRLIIQVLDDSTDADIKGLVEAECREWASKGVNIKYETRENRIGSKAGSLRASLKHPYANQCDYVAIFDADFEPEPDFLRATVPFLHHNPHLALVQAGLKFVNSNKNWLTRLQEMSQNYHLDIEQEVGSSTFAFFGFNGAAGVWRLAAIHDAGGWEDRTTVEDMDLSIRAGLRGWKFLYLGSIRVKNELPITFKAYRSQQHRWACGPAHLFRKIVLEIIRNEKVAVWKKFHIIYSFFIVRKIIGHSVTFVLYNVVIPATVFVPEVHVPQWGTAYIGAYTLVIILLLTAFGTPRSAHLMVFWVLFENVMSFHRTKAILNGLLDLRRAKEWVVTEKLGDSLKIRSGGEETKSLGLRIAERINLSELGIGFYLFFCGCYDAAFGTNHFFLYLFPQALAFSVAGFGYIGAYPRSS